MSVWKVPLSVGSASPPDMAAFLRSLSFFLDSFKDGVDLKEDGRITVNRDGGPNGSYEIVIKKVQAGDAGSYTAAASNSFGTEECVAAVTVKG